ncbi:MAG: hypothetical protein ACKVOH_05825, partial [Chlamydiales bacterium]
LVTYRDQNREQVFFAEEIWTKTSLIDLLLYKGVYGETKVVAPVLTLQRERKMSDDSKKSSTPKKEKKARSWPIFTNDLVVERGTVRLKIPHVDEIEVAQIEMNYKPHENYLSLQARTREGSVEGEVLIKGSLGEHAHIQTEITNFPVALLDQLKATSLFTEAIGETIDIKMDSENTLDGLMITVDIQSKFFDGKIKAEAANGYLIFYKESIFRFTATPQFFHELISPTLKEQWRLADKSSIVLTMNNGRIPLSLKGFSFQQFQINAQVVMERAEIEHKTLGPYSLNNVRASVVGEDTLHISLMGEVVGQEKAAVEAYLEVDQKNNMNYSVASDGFPFSLLTLFFEEADALGLFFGKTVRLRVNGVYKPQTEFISTVNISSFSSELNAEITGEKLSDLDFTVQGYKRVSGNWKNAVGEGFTFQLSGKAALLKKILAVSAFQGRIENPLFKIKLEGNLGKAGVPFSFNQVQVRGEGELLQLPPAPVFENATIREGNFSFQMNGFKNQMDAEINLALSIAANGERIDSKKMKSTLLVKNFIRENRLDFRGANIHFLGNMEYFPTAFISVWLPEGVDLTPLIGPTVTLNANLAYEPGKDPLIKADILAEAPGFKTQITMDLGSDLRVHQTKPTFLQWDLSPNRYAALMRLLSDEPVAFQLQSNAKIEMEISEIQCPPVTPTTVKDVICQSGAAGTLKVGPLHFIDPNTKEKFVLEEITGRIFGDNFSKKLHLDFKGVVDKESGFTIDMDLVHLWAKDGHLNTENAALTGTFSLNNLIMRYLTGIFPMAEVFRSKVNAVFGERINAELTAQIAQMEGPLHLIVNASNFKGIFPLHFSKNEILLRDYIDAEITLTEAVSRNFLVDINPLLITGARSGHPLKLYVAPEGFSFPIFPYSFAKLNIERAIIDIGRIEVQNGGAVQELMDFLKSKKKIKNGWMKAWFTPIFMSLKGGTAHYERFDMLLGKDVHIALWGRIDLIKDKVKMTLGIAPKTLKQRFNILGISKKEMFQVKMRGSTSNVDLDWSSAYTRIGILVARLAGGHIGYLVGGVLEQIITALGEEPTPPPTTLPFPWDEKTPRKPGDSIPEIAPPPSAGAKGSRKILEFLIP